MTTTSPRTETVIERKERQNLADIHKRIRLEKQNKGKVLNV
jgi:hypothetical protein